MFCLLAEEVAVAVCCVVLFFVESGWVGDGCFAVGFVDFGDAVLVVCVFDFDVVVYFFAACCDCSFPAVVVESVVSGVGWHDLVVLVESESVEVL